jgi:hypothetical protein
VQALELLDHGRGRAVHHDFARYPWCLARFFWNKSMSSGSARMSRRAWKSMLKRSNSYLRQPEPRPNAKRPLLGISTKAAFLGDPQRILEPLLLAGYAKSTSPVPLICHPLAVTPKFWFTTKFPSCISQVTTWPSLLRRRT